MPVPEVDMDLKIYYDVLVSFEIDVKRKNLNVRVFGIISIQSQNTNHRSLSAADWKLSAQLKQHREQNSRSSAKSVFHLLRYRVPEPRDLKGLPFSLLSLNRP
jgi:hypothetical protein